MRAGCGVSYPHGTSTNIINAYCVIVALVFVGWRGMACDRWWYVPYVACRRLFVDVVSIVDVWCMLFVVCCLLVDGVV